MKYYHGSRSKFSDFSHPGEGKHGIGFYFTPDLNEAHYFAKTLSGRGEANLPQLYTVKLKFNNLFNTMNIEHCQLVMKSVGLTYKTPPQAGGALEHYHYLAKQLATKNFMNPNLVIRQAGFDGIFYDLMEHVIVFQPEQITVIHREEILD